MILKLKMLATELSCCLLITAVCLAIGLPRYLRNIDLRDEGFLAYGAVRVMEGKIPNRDFVSLQPPLSFYTLAAVFKLFGTSLVSLRTLGLAVYILIAILVYAISRNLTGRIASLCAAIPATVIGMPFFDFVPSAVWQGVLAILMAMFLFMHAMTTNNRRWAFLAGLATAAAILSRHDQGFYLTIAVLLYVSAIKYGKQKTIEKPYLGQMLGFWTAGIMLIMLPLGIYWLFCGAVPYMFKQLIVFPLTTYARTSSLPMLTFESQGPLRDGIITAMYYLPPVVYALTAIWMVITLIRRRFCADHAGVAFVLVVSIFFYCQVLTRSDLHHLIITLPPFFILYMWCAQAVSRTLSNVFAKRYMWRKPAATRICAAAILLTVCAATLSVLLYTEPVFLESLKTPKTLLSLERAGVWLKPEGTQLLDTVTKIIHSNAEPNDAILCLPYAPMYYFLSARHNPTQWNYLWPGDQTVGDHQTLVKQAKMDAPAVVIIVNKDWMQVHAPIIDAYVKSEYKAAFNLETMAIYLPLNRQKDNKP